MLFKQSCLVIRRRDENYNKLKKKVTVKLSTPFLFI